MSYFDDIESSRNRIQKEWPRRSKRHLTTEEFQPGDGRFLMRKTLCGLELAQSSGMLARRISRVTCKGCLAKQKGGGDV